MGPVSPGNTCAVEHGPLNAFTVLVAGEPDETNRLRGALLDAGASVVSARTPYAAAVAASVRPQVTVVVGGGDAPQRAEELARNPELYPLATVLAAPREHLGGQGAGPWTAVVGLPAADAELVAAVRSAAHLRQLRDELLAAERRFERDALTDPLTDAPNRRHFERSLTALSAGARRHGRPLSVVLVDLDDFKQVNDRHGHLTGDAILRGITERLGARLRAEDVLARLGGDELGVLLPDTDAAAGAKVAGELCAAVAAEPFDVPAGALGAHVSAGHATLHPGEHVQALLDRADAALYTAKRAGGGVAASAECAAALRR
jgi:diguanylate cyclase (GGDEF)-like protein